MLCGCIPIGSSVNMLPEIIGSSGFIVEHRDLSDIYDTIQMALNSENKDSLSLLARHHVLNNFSLSKRAGLIHRSEEHTSELQSRGHLVCRLLLERKKN